MRPDETDNPKKTGDEPHTSAPLPGEPSLKKVTIVIVTLIVVGGAILAWSELRPILTYRPTTAHVLSSWVETRASRSGMRGYVPRVDYSYVFAGHEWHGTRVTPRDLMGDSSWAAAQASLFHTGAEVTAYVNPGAPAEAFLIRSVAWRPYADIGGVLLLILTGALWVRSARARRQGLPRD